MDRKACKKKPSQYIHKIETIAVVTICGIDKFFSACNRGINFHEEES